MAVARCGEPHRPPDPHLADLPRRGGLGGLVLLAGLCRGSYGAEPINVLEREYGLTALQLLVAGLAVTPLRTWAGINLIKFRRAIGLTAFFFILAHFLGLGAAGPACSRGDLGRHREAALHHRRLCRAGSADPAGADLEQLERPQVGFTLAQPAQAHLRRGPLAALHFIWLVKAFPWEPLAYLAAIGGLLLARVRWTARGRPAVARSAVKRGARPI